jgi:enoyl-CoA hydratase
MSTDHPPVPVLPADCVVLVLEAPGLNAIGAEVLDRLLRGLEGAGDRPVLLRAAPPAFSAGLNLKEVLGLDLEGTRAFLSQLQALVEALHHHPGPTVAAVDGHAIAGGALLARACDRVVARAGGRGKIGLNEVALGLRFPPRVLGVVQARVSRQSWSELLLGAGLHSAEDALRIGLVDELSDDPLGRAAERLQQLAAHPRGAYAATKSALYPRTPTTAAELEDFHGAVVPLWNSPEIKGRIQAALRK